MKSKGNLKKYFSDVCDNYIKDYGDIDFNIKIKNLYSILFLNQNMVCEFILSKVNSEEAGSFINQNKKYYINEF